MNEDWIAKDFVLWYWGKYCSWNFHCIACTCYSILVSLGVFFLVIWYLLNIYLDLRWHIQDVLPGRFSLNRRKRILWPRILNSGSAMVEAPWLSCSALSWCTRLGLERTFLSAELASSNNCFVRSLWTRRRLKETFVSAKLPGVRQGEGS